MSAIALGGIAAVPSYFALVWRAKTSLDDSLDVVAAHGVGGTVGALLTGVFAQKALNGLADGALFGNPGQLVIQVDSGRRRDRLQRRHELRPAQADLAGHAAARRPRTTRRRVSTSACTAKKPTCTRRGRRVGTLAVGRCRQTPSRERSAGHERSRRRVDRSANVHALCGLLCRYASARRASRGSRVRCTSAVSSAEQSHVAVPSARQL